MYRFGDVNDKEMDALLTKSGDADDNRENGMWIDSAPLPYSWAYGDTVHYKLHTPVPVDEKKVKWRVTNGHCVKNPCTGTNDCHMHEVSLPSDTGMEGGCGHAGACFICSFFRLPASGFARGAR